jgi:phosphodiesterase/alkaline phosphatase D-like protein
MCFRLHGALRLLAFLAGVVPVRAEDATAYLTNISARAPVGGPAGTPIVGFGLGGAGTKPMLVRAVGPTLAGYGVAEPLPDPRISLLSGSSVVAANEDWLAADEVTMRSCGAFALLPGSRDAAVVPILGAGVYSAPVPAPNDSRGVAMLELYDPAPAAGPRVINASTRAFVGTGAEILIAGFVVGGNGPLRVLVRAIGPGLIPYGVLDALADPLLTVFAGQTAIASNDNWSSPANAAEVVAAAAASGAFALANGSRDAALLLTLPPGSYSAQVSGAGNGTGSALIEIYPLPPAGLSAGATPAEVTVSPGAPNYADPVFVTARAQPGFAAGGGVLQLAYTAGAAAAPATVTMQDDGAHGDGMAGDDIFGAVIPAQAAGTKVSYEVTAGAATTPGSYVVGSTLWDYKISDAGAPLGLTAPEFLGIPTDHGVTLNLEANRTVELYVEYGSRSGTYVAQTPVATYPAGTPIELKIEAPPGAPPLAGDRRYFYRVRYREPGQTEFRTRGERSFVTARPRGATFTFTITADPHLDEVTSQPLFTLAMRNVAADQPDFHVDLGDIFMSDKLATILPGLPINAGLIEYRAVTLRNNFAEFAHSVPFMFTLGNHEAEYRYVYDADRSAAKDQNVATWNLLARKAYFPTPVPDGAFYSGSAETRLIAARSELLENYYAWEWGDALFVVLDPFNNTLANPNSNPADNWRWSLGRAQYDWLKATLEGSGAKYKFLFLHHLVGGIESARGGVETARRYEWGGRNADDTDGFAAKRPGWGVPIHDLLRANRVSAVFHGHDHFYAYQTLDGIVYQECPQPGTANFSTGSATDGRYVQGTILPNSGHLRVTVGPDGARVEYVRAALPNQETPTLRNRTISHRYTIAPAR